MLKTCIILGSFGVLLVAGLPAPQDDEYADEEVCLTSKESKASEIECVFPFIFNNFTYNGCPTDPIDTTKRWCSTKVDETGNHITGGDNWGYCTKGCPPEIFPDELILDSEAGEAASDACDWTACNGLTLKINVFDKEVTYGQCQVAAGNDGSEDDYFCFVNADSICADKTLYDEENNLYVSSTACTDPRAPLPRGFGFPSFGNNHFSGGSSFGRNRYSWKKSSSSSSSSFSSGGNFGNSGGNFGNSGGNFGNSGGNFGNSGGNFGNNGGNFGNSGGNFGNRGGNNNLGGCCGGGSSFSSQKSSSSSSQSSFGGGFGGGSSFSSQSSSSSSSFSSWRG